MLSSYCPLSLPPISYAKGIESKKKSYEVKFCLLFRSENIDCHLDLQLVNIPISNPHPKGCTNEVNELALLQL